LSSGRADRHGAACFARGAAIPRPIIIDCDPGTDDAVALLLALASPELDVAAITVVGGNVGLDRTVANACAVRSLAGAADEVPVYAGAGRALLADYASAVRVHGADGLGGIALPPGTPPAVGLAADILRDRLRHGEAKVTLVGIGPATNLALALATEPGLVAAIDEIVLMSGTWGSGNITKLTEFNAASDPEALAIVLACGAPVTLATLDLTAQARVTPARIAHLRALGGGRCLAAACDILASVPNEPGSADMPAGHPLHDPCAIAWLLRPALFTAQACTATVVLAPGEQRGRTVIDRRPDAPGPVRALERLDADGFFALLGERLAALP
jgi:purine nucleosidase